MTSIVLEDMSHNEPNEDIRVDSSDSDDHPSTLPEPQKMKKVRSIMAVKSYQKPSDSKKVRINEKGVEQIPGETSGIVPKIRSKQFLY